MTTHTYSFRGYDKEKMAKVVGRDLPISTKHSVEICNFIRGKNIQKAKETLSDVVMMKKPVPFKRFTEGAGHKKGKIAAGRYPVKATKEVMNLLDSLEANAQQKGLDTSNLVIMHICANRASRPPRYGRIRGRLAKRSHVEIVAAESEKQAEKPREEKKQHTEKREATKTVPQHNQEHKKEKGAEQKPKAQPKVKQ